MDKDKAKEIFDAALNAARDEVARIAREWIDDIATLDYEDDETDTNLLYSEQIYVLHRVIRRLARDYRQVVNMKSEKKDD